MNIHCSEMESEKHELVAKILLSLSEKNSDSEWVSINLLSLEFEKNKNKNLGVTLIDLLVKEYISQKRIDGFINYKPTQKLIDKVRISENA